MSGTNRNLLKPLFRPELFRIAAGAVSEEIAVNGDRLYLFASGLDTASASLHVWGRARCMVPAAAETTVPPTTIPLEIPDPLTESSGWFDMGEFALSIAADKGPAAPDGRANEYSSQIAYVDCQMCDMVKLVATSVSGIVTVWAAPAEAVYIAPNS